MIIILINLIVVPKKHKMIQSAKNSIFIRHDVTEENVKLMHECSLEHMRIVTVRLR